MNTVLSFMDKLYSDSKTLSIVYVIGAVLLFIFIILLMVSLRKTDKKEQTKIIEEPKIDEEPKEVLVEDKKEEAILKEELAQEKEEVVEEVQEEPLEQSIFEKTTIIPLSELEEQPVSREENIAQALENVEKQEQVEENKKEEVLEEVSNLGKDIPNVDAYVESIMKKAYEKNEQFSSVFVGNNTSTIKLDKVMENLNVDEEVKDNIVPEDEKSVETKNVEVQSVISEETSAVNEASNEEEIELPKVEEKIETPQVVEKKLENTVSLDGLKKALEEKQKEVTIKQDDLKAKLEGLKQTQPKSNETIKAEDLLNKLNSMKEE